MNGSGAVGADGLEIREFLGFNKLTMLVEQFRSRVLVVNGERVRKVAHQENQDSQALGPVWSFEHLMASDHCAKVIGRDDKWDVEHETSTVLSVLRWLCVLRYLGH